ncbi:MAG: hypothetical protein A2W35_09845 [Chloroflexi bacterium RBG_16_57_11]|nr:MAG: hypothetical protein A2W35_09845 [Chloroflexi bacterium RBG_16_57_11]
MRIDQSLFEGEHICFGPIDHELDPEIESLWTHDASYLRLISLDPALPLSPARIKKRYEAIEKEQNVFEYNPRAVRSYEKVGFKHEGRARGVLHRAGRRWDLIFMGILREEWEAQQKNN